MTQTDPPARTARPDGDPAGRSRGTLVAEPCRVLTAPVPEALDAPDAWALHGVVAVARASDAETYGHDDFAVTARSLWVRVRDQEDDRRALLVALAPSGGATADDATAAAEPGAGVPGAATAADVLGYASVVLPRRSNTHLAHLAVVVRPDARGRGIGATLLRAAEARAAAEGRTTTILSSEHAGEPPADARGVLEPPSGAGRIARAAPGAALCLRHGYALEQASRYSVLELPVDGDLLARLRDEAAVRAGTDYRLLSWQDRTPEERLDALALLETRMSTDEPLGGLDVQEDPWDAARVRRREAQIAAAGHGYLLVAAEHVPTGALAGFTMVRYERDRPAPVFQEDTIVLREHRGRRLGMLMKADLLQRLATVRPGARRVHTWNAEENAFMLGINVALGFRPAGVEGEWQKRLG